MYKCQYQDLLIYAIGLSVCADSIIVYFKLGMKIAKREHAILNALWIALLPCSTCWAQMIEVVSAEGDTVVYDAELGADLALSIRADFLDNAVTGCVFYLALPNGFFALPADAPFSQGELLFGASEFANDLLT